MPQKRAPSNSLEDKNPPTLGALERNARFLTQGVSLTSAIVDLAHGKIEKDSLISQYLYKLLEHIFDMSETNLESIDQSEQEEVNHELWNQICQSRRILQRILLAINGSLHRKALSDGSTQINVLTIRRLRELHSRTSNVILSESRKLRNSTNTEPWYKLAIAYEATIVLRAQGRVGAAIELAELCRFKKSTKPQSYNKEVRGLFSFNYKIVNYFTEQNMESYEDEEEYDQQAYDAKYPSGKPLAQDMLFRLSKRISRNSKSAASQSLNQSDEDLILPLTFLVTFKSIWEDKKFKIHHSGIIHMEGLLRVCAYHTSWNTIQGLRSIVPLIIVDIYDNWLSKEISDSNVDEWLKEVLLAKTKEDLGCLFSDMCHRETFTKEASDKNPELVASITERMKVWETDRDSPVMVRRKFYDSLEADLTKRANSLEMGILPLNMVEMNKTIGRYSENNPLTSSGLAKFLSTKKKAGREEDQEPSRHLRHLPQGDLNRAQVAISMAFQQSISRKDRPTFSKYFVIGEKVNDKNQIVKGGRIQFTKGHFKVVKDEKEQMSLTNLHHRNGDEKSSSARTHLSRVNRLDGMMFVANAMNYVFKVIESEIDLNLSASKRIERLLSECRVDLLIKNLDLPEELADSDYPHPHELIYLAEEASSSPMRIVKPDDAENDFEILDRVLRVSFARIYSLSFRLEHLARILSNKPLREPYLSSCVIVVDQCRFLLNKINEDWIDAYRSNSDEGEPTFKFQKEEFENAKMIVNKKRKNIFDVIKAQDLLSTEVMPDVAVEYLLSACVKQSNSEKLYEYINSKLDFLNSIDEWEKLLGTSKVRLNELPSQRQPTDIKGIEKYDSPPRESSVPDLLKVVEDKGSEREKSYWQRLYDFPTAFVGRVMVSANTPRDINRDENSIAAFPILSLEMKRIIHRITEKSISNLIDEQSSDF